ncbi:MAG: hypothetical protein ACM3NH_03195 [Candidatus Saccharibacteria bacterium]
MNKSLIIRAIVIWLLFLPVPIINGTLREMWYKARVGELASNAIGCVVLSGVFLLYVYFLMGSRLLPLNLPQLFILGGLWLMLTLAFEFGIGIAGHRSWAYMLADYRIWEGRLWPIVLVVVLFAPQVIKRLIEKQ